MKQFWIVVMIALLSFSGMASAQKQNPYQFDDVSGYPGGSGIGAQWVGLSSVSRDFPQVVTNSIGDSSRSQMQVAGDLLINNKTLVLVSADAHRGDLFNTAFFVIPEGRGSLSVNFAYNGGGSEPVTLGVYGANFENTYPSIVSQPTPGELNSTNVAIEAVKKQGTERIYESAFGELIFHQNPTNTPSQSTHVPFVIANVHDGDASGAPLAIKSTTRSISGDIVGRRWFDWTVQADKTVEPAEIDWIFVPVWDEVIDHNQRIQYKFTTEVTNHSGIRYGVQRYDSPNNNLDAVHWKFDLQPIPERLPKTFQLDKLSHIVPGLVTVYSHDASVTPGQQNLLRLAAVDPLKLRGSKALQLRYRTIYGYDLGSAHDSGTSSFWTLNAYKAYPSTTDFFKRALQAMDVPDGKYVFPERSADILAGNVSNSFVTADALSSFKISAPVPGWTGASSDDLSPGMLGLNVTLRIPKDNRFIKPLWDAFAASRNLTNDFAEHFSIRYRSPKDVDLDLSEYLTEEAKYDRIVKVFLDEERECVTVQYLLLLVEGNERGRDRKPRIRIVPDTTTVNDYDYMVVDDGIDDGKWEMTFFVSPVTPVVGPVAPESGGGGCSAGSLWFSPLLLAPLLLRKKNFNTSVFLAAALIFCSAAYAEGPATVTYEQDLPSGTQGSLRWAIDKVNSGATDTVMFNNLSSISLAAPALVISSDVIIEGNGTMITNAGAGRLFEVIAGASVTFRALTFNGGEPSGNGGAVLITNGSVKFDKCTFSENSASSGGAVYAEAASSASFTNCTFYLNRSTANGGAVAGDTGSHLSFAFVTMYGNNAGGAGEGAYANGTSSFLASVFLGNGVNSNDVYTSGASTSQGYNAVGNDILPWPAGEGDLAALSAADIFPSNPTPERNYAAPGWRNWPLTFALLNRSTNPILDSVPETVLTSNSVIVDQRYVMRAQGSSKKSSVGAYEVYTKDPPITEFQIGGLPNGTATVGFSTLLATSISPSNANPGITWGPSPNPEIYEVTPYGKIWIKGKGNSILKATSDGYDPTGKRKSISIPIIVKYASEENPGYTLPDPNAETAENKKDEKGGGGGCNGGITVAAAFLVIALAARKLKTALLSILLIAAISFSADAASFTAEISPSNVQLKPTATSDLTVTTDPAGTFTYAWSSGSTSVATVSGSGNMGTVTAVANGTTTISCIVTSTDGTASETETVTCEVKVLKPATSITISPRAYETSISGSFDITVTVEPGDADSPDVEWEIKTPGTAATINVKPDDSKTVTFTAVSFPGPNSAPIGSLPIPYNASTKNPIRVVAKLKYWDEAPVSNDSCDVIIHPIPITSVTVSPKLISLDAAKPNDEIAAEIDPVNATMTSADWFSSNSLAIGITSPSSALTNTVVSKKQGESKVRYVFSGWLISGDATHAPLFASDDSTVICVSPPPPIGVSQVDITDPAGNLKLQAGLSYQFVALVIPYNAAERSLIWTTDNPLAATVNNGYVTAVYPGTATITAASTENPRISASRTVTVVAAPSTGTDEPSTVEITPDIANRIESENERLRRSGCEVNFGFMTTNKPHESSLTAYGQTPKIISALTAAPQVSLAPLPNVAGVLGSSGMIEMDVSSYNKAKQTAIMPISLKFIITATDIREHIEGDVNAIIADPYSNLDLLFRTFSIKKQIIDPTRTDNLVPMIPNVISAQTAARSGILILKNLGDKIEVTLNYYVSDSANTFASIADGNIVIGDGAANGIIRDPVWVVAPAGTGGGSTDSGGGGGCNSAIAFGALLLVPLLKLRRKYSGLPKSDNAAP